MQDTIATTAVLFLKAYIPLQCNISRVGGLCWTIPPTCWYLKTLKFALPPRRTKFALPPTQNPNASQWNIGYFESPGVGACIGHVRMTGGCLGTVIVPWNCHSCQPLSPTSRSSVDKAQAMKYKNSFNYKSLIMHCHCCVKTSVLFGRFLKASAPF